MKRRILLYLRSIIIIAFLLGIGFLLVKIFTGSFFQVDTVLVYGHEDIISDPEILIRKRNILTFSAAEMESQLTLTPLIKAASVSRQFPRTLIVVVTERIPVVEYQVFNKFLFIDSDGIALPTIPRFGNNLPILNCNVAIEKAGDQIKQDQVIYGLKLLALLKTIQVQELECLPTGAMKLSVDDTKIIFDSGRNVTELAASLQFLFKQFRIEGKQPDMVDMRFEKPVLIPDGVEVATSSTESAQP